MSEATAKRCLRAVDLCCGAGGWAAAARGLPITWVAVADIAPDCIETWRVNHSEYEPGCRAITCDLSTEDGAKQVIDAAAGGVDLVVGGIPCEQVSVARPGPADSAAIDDWHRLIDRCLHIVDVLQPTYWAIEDVIQIEKHLPPPLFHGYEIPLRRINAAAYSAQQRVRTFLGSFPEPAAPEVGPRTLADVLRPGPHLIISGAERYEGAWALNGQLSLGSTKIRLLPPDKPCPTITTSIGLRGGRHKRQFTVVDDRGRRRMLSWQEAAAVQGFPGDYLFVGGITRAQEMIGRAIPIPVGRAILRAMCDDARRIPLTARRAGGSEQAR